MITKKEQKEILELIELEGQYLDDMHLGDMHPLKDDWNTKEQIAYIQGMNDVFNSLMMVNKLELNTKDSLENDFIAEDYE